MTETEIENLVVRLSTDVGGYMEGMKAAEDRVNQLAKKIGEAADKSEKSLSEKLAGGINNASSRIADGTNAMKTAMDLVKGKFDTTGDAMRNMAGVAAAIPGPWGVAVSGILSAGSLLVDFFDHKFNRTMMASRQAFMSVVGGMRTFHQAERELQLTPMIEATEQIVKSFQRRGLEIAPGMEVSTFPPGIIDRPQLVRNLAERALRQAQDSRDALNEMRNNPDLQAQLFNSSMTQTSGGMEDQLEGMGMRLGHRRMFRAMHGRQEIGVATRGAQQAQQTMFIRQMERQLGRDIVAGSTEEMKLLNAIIPLQERLASVIQQTRREQLTSELEEKTEKHHDSMLEQADVTERLRRQQAGASDEEIRSMEQAQAARRELNELSRRGATGGELATRAFQLLQAAAQNQMNEALRQGNQIMEQNRTPVETYERQVAHLGNLLEQGAMSQETYNRAIARAGESFRGGFGEAIGIVNRFRDPLDVMEEQIRSLNDALEAGAIGSGEYARALDGLAAEADKVNRILQPVQQVAAGSAEALTRIANQSEMFAPISERLRRAGRTPPTGGSREWIDNDWMFGRDQSSFGENNTQQNPSLVAVLGQLAGYLGGLAGRRLIPVAEVDLDDAD